MIQFTCEEISTALQVVSSTIDNCEKIQPKFAEGTSQYSLLKNRIKALYISKALLNKSNEIEKYSVKDLIDSMKPVDSIIRKCNMGQRKHDIEALQYKRFQKIIDAMNVAKTLIADEINNRG